MRHPNRQRGRIDARWRGLRAIAVAGSAALVGALFVAASATPGLASASRPAAANGQAAANTCHLANGIKHVVQIGFDNVHFFRDNPNVPSDLEMLPNLLHFLEANGTFLSNNHTPLIAHTGDDLLTTATGLYGDRHGDGIANSYQAYNADGTTDPATVFTYWNDAIDDTASTPNAGHDTNPNLVYSPTPPATTNPPVKPDTVAPAPWVPFTRAGCDVGEIATVNQELENTSPSTSPRCSAPTRRRRSSSPPTRTPSRTPRSPTTSAWPCTARRAARSAPAPRASSTGRPRRRTRPWRTCCPMSPAATPATRPSSVTGTSRRSWARGTANLTHDGYQVTNAAGNLVDLNGNQINGAFLTNHPGFPGYGQHQRVAVPGLRGRHAGERRPGGATLHVRPARQRVHHRPDGPGQPCYKAPDALGSGSACYVAQAQYYNQAFGTFFKRLAADGITREEHAVRGQLRRGRPRGGRQRRPGDPAHPGQLRRRHGHRQHGDPGRGVHLPGRVVRRAGRERHRAAGRQRTTPPRSAWRATRRRSSTSPATRGRIRPRCGPSSATSRISPRPTRIPAPPRRSRNYLADPTEEAILHIVNADPARTPTLAMFAKPDYFLSTGPATCSGACVPQNTGFAWDHGDYAAEIDTNYAGFAGPGVTPPGSGRSVGRARADLVRPGQRPDRGARTTPPARGWTRPTSGRRSCT